MSDLDLLVENFLKPKEAINMSSLVKLVEEVMQENDGKVKLSLQEKRRSSSKGRRTYNLVLGQFKAPTEQAGKFDTTERQTFQRYISRNITGTTLAEKIEQINQIASGQADEDAPISEILASMGALKMLQQTLDDFNESTAGFLFEAFLSALLSGTQVTDRVGGTLPIEDCMFFVDPKTGEMGQPVSLKLLSTRTIIEGSIVNLLGFFKRPDIAAVAEEKGIEYIVATKTKGNRLDVYSFTITPSNFFEWLDEKHFNFEAPEFLSAFEAESVPLSEVSSNDPEDIKRAARVWMNNVRTYRYPMMGLTTDDELKMDWKKITDWRNVIPTPSSAASKREQIATNVLSDAAKRSFESFSRPKFGVENIEALQIPAEIEAQFLQQENPEARTAAATELVKIARARRAAYLNTIAGWGLDQPESPAHIQRYFAILNPKTGQMKAIDAQEKLQALVQTGDAQSIIKWATALEAARAAKGDTQFHIKPITVRGRSTVYGTVNLSERALVRSLSRYSSRLEQLVLPIYETLSDLTDHINGFYFENKPADAFRASADAEALAELTKQLTSEVDEK